MGLINELGRNVDFGNMYTAIYTEDSFGHSISDVDGVQVYFELEFIEDPSRVGWLDTVRPIDVGGDGIKTNREHLMNSLVFTGFFGYHPEWNKYDGEDYYPGGLAINNLTPGVLNTIKKSDMPAFIDLIEQRVINERRDPLTTYENPEYANIFRFMCAPVYDLFTSNLAIFNTLNLEVFCDIKIKNLFIAILDNPVYDPGNHTIASKITTVDDAVIKTDAELYTLQNDGTYAMLGKDTNKDDAIDYNIPLNFTAQDTMHANALIFSEGENPISAYTPLMYVKYKIAVSKFKEIYNSLEENEGGRCWTDWDKMPFIYAKLTSSEANEILTTDNIWDWRFAYYNVRCTMLGFFEIDADILTSVMANPLYESNSSYNIMSIKNTDGTFTTGVRLLGASMDVDINYEGNNMIDNTSFYNDSIYLGGHGGGQYLSSLDWDETGTITNDIDAVFSKLKTYTEDGTEYVNLYLAIHYPKEATTNGDTPTTYPLFSVETPTLKCGWVHHSLFSIPEFASSNDIKTLVTLADVVDVGKIKVTPVVAGIDSVPNGDVTLEYIVESSEDAIEWKLLSNKKETIDALDTSEFSSLIIDVNGYKDSSTVLTGKTLSKFSQRYIKIETDSSGYVYERINGVLTQTTNKYLVLKSLNIINGNTKLPYTILGAYTSADTIYVDGEITTLMDVASKLNVDFATEDIKINTNGKITFIIDLGETAVSFDKIKVITGEKTDKGMHEFKYTVSYSGNLNTFTTSTTINPETAVSSSISETTTF